MYYYIVSPAKSRKDEKVIAAIRDLIGRAGVNGQFVTPSPARTIEELVEMSSSEEYTTIVAVGEDNFINNVFANFARQEQTKIDIHQAFGVIPLNLSGNVAHLFRITSFEMAIEALKNRRLIRLQTALLEPKKYFLSPLVVTPSGRQTWGIETDRWQAIGQFTQAEISPWGTIIVKDLPKQSFWKSIFSSEEAIAAHDSFFTTDSFRFITKNPTPVYLEKEIWAKTPARVKMSSSPLHFIFPRVRVEPFDQQTR